jgi:hypothetical protein
LLALDVSSVLHRRNGLQAHIQSRVEESFGAKVDLEEQAAAAAQAAAAV